MFVIIIQTSFPNEKKTPRKIKIEGNPFTMLKIFSQQNAFTLKA